MAGRISDTDDMAAFAKRPNAISARRILLFGRSSMPPLNGTYLCADTIRRTTLTLESFIALRWFRSRRHRIGGALKGCRLLEHVATHVLTPFMGGSLGELLGALAISGRTSDGDGLGHCGI
jgi:hypothetical protein